MGKFKPKDSTVSPRYCNIRTFMNLPNVKTLEDVDFVIAGVPFDTACTTRAGARYGPEGIRSASILLRPYNDDMGINVFEYLSGVDYGDFAINPVSIEKSNEMITDQACEIFEASVVPVFMGGDHSVSFPLIRAASKTYGKIAVIHFDSHSDTDTGIWGVTHAHNTPFYNLAQEEYVDTQHSVQVGLRGPTYGEDGLNHARELGYRTLTRKEMRKKGIEKSIEIIKERIKDTNAVYVSFDIDFLDPAYAPGTGTLEVGGFTTWEAQWIIQEALEDANLIGMDLVEVNPAFDDAGQITSYAASNIMYEFITQLALKKKKSICVKGFINTLTGMQ